MRSHLLLVVRDYYPLPGPRYDSEGDYSGESFRGKILYPELETARELGRKLYIDLDGTTGYATSFLEEAFGGLIRVRDVAIEDLMIRLDFISNEERYLPTEIWGYVKKAFAEKVVHRDSFKYTKAREG